MRIDNNFLLVMFVLLCQIIIISDFSIVFSTKNQDYEINPGGTLIDSSQYDVKILNPILSNDETSHKIEDLIFERLITFDEDMEIIPQLAKSWEISSNKFDYKFHLRDDIFWHDGEPFTAEDVIFTWDRFNDPETKRVRYDTIDLLDYDNNPFEMIDDYTVIFHLQTTYSPMLNDLMLPIIPEHVYLNHYGVDGIKHTDDDCRDINGTYTFNDDPANENPVGTGSMMFFAWEKDDNITLIRNSVENNGSGYWNEHDAYLDRYMLRIISDPNVQLLSLKSGNIDMIDLGSIAEEDIDDLISDPEFQVFISEKFAYDHIAFQTDPERGNLYGSTSRDFKANPNHFAGYEWMIDENPSIYGYLIRQALNYGLDKDNLINNTYHTSIRNLGPIYFAQHDWYNENVNPYDYNLTIANELLEKAGFGATANDTLRSELDFRITFDQGNLRHEKIAINFHIQLANLGIDVEISSLNWDSILSNQIYTRNFDAIVTSTSGGGGDPDLSKKWSSKYIMPSGQPTGTNPDGTWIWEGTPKEGGLNYMSYWNPEVDIMMDEARTEETTWIREDYYDQIQEKVVNDCPYIWLFAQKRMTAISSDIRGFVNDSVVGLWPEPIGFSNIYFLHSIPIGTDEENFTPSFIFWQVIFSSIVIIAAHKRFRKKVR